MGLSKNQKRAVEELFHRSEREVARLVGVTEETLERWKSLPAFRMALAERAKAIRAAAARILSRSSLTAAEKLKALIDAAGGADGKGADPKLLLDTLKASGLFDVAAEPESGPTLEQVIAEAERLAREDRSDGAREDRDDDARQG